MEWWQGGLGLQFCRLSFKETTQASVNDTDDISEQQTLGVEKMFFYI